MGLMIFPSISVTVVCRSSEMAVSCGVSSVGELLRFWIDRIDESISVIGSGEGVLLLF